MAKLSPKEIDEKRTAAELRLTEIEDELETLLAQYDIDVDPDARMIHDTLVRELDKILEDMEKLVSAIDED